VPGRSEPPPELLSGPFTPRRARELGISSDVLRGRRFDSPYHGVRVPTGLGDGLEVRCRALAQLVPQGAFSHATSARLRGLPLPAHLGDLVDLSVPTGVRAPRSRGVRGHTGLREADVQLLRSGLRVVRMDVTWGDLASGLGVDDLVVLGDALLRRGHSDVAALARMAAGERHRRGTRVMQSALPLLEPATDSPMETRLRLLIVRAGLPRPLANRDVIEDGGWIARPDLSYPQWRIAIEYEGDHHHTDREQWRRDKTRRRLLEDFGWLVIEVIADDVLRTPEITVARIRRTIEQRSRRA
jgi:hypothetical protein